MADAKIPPGGVPIVGQTQHRYPIGDPEEEGSALTLSLTVTPVQAVQMFNGYMADLARRGKGPPVPFVLTWVYVSKGLSFFMRKYTELKTKFETLEERVESLEKRDV